MDGNLFFPAKAGNGNGYGRCPRINGTDQTARAALLPILLLLLPFRVQIGPRHGDDLKRIDALACSLPAHANPVANLQVLKLNRGRLLQVLRPGSNPQKPRTRCDRDGDVGTRILAQGQGVSVDGLDGANSARDRALPLVLGRRRRDPESRQYLEGQRKHDRSQIHEDRSNLLHTSPLLYIAEGDRNYVIYIVLPNVHPDFKEPKATVGPT